MNTGILADGRIEIRGTPQGGGLDVWQDGERLPWHIDIEDAARVSVRESGAVTEHPVRLAALTERRLGPARMQWLGEIHGAGVALEAALDDGAMIFSVSPLCTGPNALVSAVWPGRVSGTGRDREAFWAAGNDAALYRAVPGVAAEHLNPWWLATLRLGGLTVAGRTLALIVDTPFDAQSRFMDDGRGRISVETAFLPSLGELTYTRRWRLTPTGEPGHVAAVDLFRRYAQKHGLWKSWAERVAERPAVARLEGAFLACAGYLEDLGADPVAAMRFMRDFGFERGYLFSPRFYTFDDANWCQAMGAPPNRLTDAQLAAIQALGYVCSPFLQVEETTLGVGEPLMARDAEGKPIIRWQVGATQYAELAKWRVPGMLDRLEADMLPCDGVHFDTVAAMGLIENWGTPGPYGRADDARFRTQILDYYRRRGKIVASEHIKDWSVPFQDFGTSRGWTPWITREADRLLALPLTELVYHDCIIRSTWEHTAWNDDSHDRDLNRDAYRPWALILGDYLTAAPPVLFPEGRMYRYLMHTEPGPNGETRIVRDWTRKELYGKRHTDADLQALLPEALKLCRLNRRHGVARMTRHRFVEPTRPEVQESEFATGLHVVVNYGDEPYPLPGGHTVGAHAVLVEE